MRDNHAESWHQTEVFKWCAVQGLADPRYRCIFAIPNGGLRDKVTASRLKAQGVRAGVPDIFLAVPAHGVHGLFIELKREGGKAAKQQIEWKERLLEQGYGVAICVGHEETKALIQEYLK